MHKPTNRTYEPQQTILNSYRLPARLDTDHVAALLGFAQHDIQILTREKLLQPLGKPAPNAPKWFAACAVEQLRVDSKWLNTATRAVSMYWKNKRERLIAKSTPTSASPIGTT